METNAGFGLAGQGAGGLNGAMQAPGPPPHPQAFQDAEHLKLLAIFHYVLAGLSAVFGCFFIIHIVMGGMMISGGMSGGGSGPPPPQEIGWLFIIGGCFAILMSWAMAVALFLAGRWLSARRNWTYCFVVACISCLSVPLGTALGVFTIIVLQRPSVKALFGRPLPGGYLNR